MGVSIQQPMSAQARAVWPWLVYLNTDVTQQFGQNGETGVDIGMPQGTPITSLTAGVVLGSGYYGGGGVVSISSQVMGRMRSVYYQHLDQALVQVGQQVNVGDLIGLSGGQLSGGTHPSSPRFSTGPHLEVGLDAPYGGMWAPQGPNVNPIPWLTSLYVSGAPSPTHSWLQQILTMVGATAGNPPGPGAVSIAQVPGFLPVAELIEDAEHWPGFDITSPIGSTLGGIEAFSIRAIIVLVGVAFLLLVLVNVMKATNDAFGGLPGEFAQDAGKAAAMGAV